ncbi:MAG: hypothetical protein J6U54_17700 [Clostridiales bacterium]|nr:hypothetical protein [Clostridiales bacterium]
MVDYYAIVNGKFCYKLMPADLNDIPERSEKTNWFYTNQGDLSDVYWAPVPDAQNNYACQLIMKLWLEDDDIKDADGVYEVIYSGSGDTVNKLSNTW